MSFRTPSGAVGADEAHGASDNAVAANSSDSIANEAAAGATDGVSDAISRSFRPSRCDHRHKRSETGLASSSELAAATFSAVGCDAAGAEAAAAVGPLWLSSPSGSLPILSSMVRASLERRRKTSRLPSSSRTCTSACTSLPGNCSSSASESPSAASRAAAAAASSSLASSATLSPATPAILRNGSCRSSTAVGCADAISEVAAALLRMAVGPALESAGMAGTEMHRPALALTSGLRSSPAARAPAMPCSSTVASMLGLLAARPRCLRLALTNEMHRPVRSGVRAGLALARSPLASPRAECELRSAKDAMLEVERSSSPSSSLSAVSRASPG